MINWNERISKDDKYIDMQGLPYYYLEFADKPEQVEYYGIKVNMPKEPKNENCVNYGLPKDKQIFRKTLIPEQVRFPSKDFGRQNWTQKELDSFIDQQWQFRLNGLWMFIKGKKYYIPGQLWFKMNAWTSITNEDFEYRDHERQLFHVLLHLQRDPIDLGIADFKCRQLGDTENVLVVTYDRGSRIRGGLNTLQSFTGEDHVKETYNRLIHGYKNMIYYFKPMSDGTEKAAAGLNLNYPAKHFSHAEIKKQHQKNEDVNKSAADEYQYLPLNSRFRYATARAIKFDGATGILTAYGDEFGKATENDPNEWLRTMVEAVFSNIRGKKRGFVMMTSTAEEINANSLEFAQTLHAESNPNKRLKTGSTLNRIVGIFRGVADRGFENIVADKFGFIDGEAVIAAVTEKYNAMIEAGNVTGAMSFLRKNPRTLDDVFLSANNLSQFHTINLQKRNLQIDMMPKKPFVRGNLKWRDGIRDTEVIWEPNQQGKWEISKHPHDFGLQSNARTVGLYAKKPANTFFFSTGVDPIDQKNSVGSEEELSKMSFCVGRRFDPEVDKGEHKYYQYDDDIRGIQKGDPLDLGSFHETNRAVCIYMERPDDPSVAFEDLLMTLVYYGSDYLPEKNKSGALLMYMQNRGYESFLMDKPTYVKNHKGKVEKDGVTMSEKSANTMFDHITTYTVKWANALDFPRLIAQLSTMNWKNRGKRDLGVAFGWMLYAFHNKIQRKEIDKEEEARGITHWEENAV